MARAGSSPPGSFNQIDPSANAIQSRNNVADNSMLTTTNPLALTLVLLLTQIIELCSSEPLKRTALIYYTCANGTSLLLAIFTAIGLITNPFQVALNSKYTIGTEKASQ